jgi:hypothetical protein
MTMREFALLDEVELVALDGETRPDSEKDRRMPMAKFLLQRLSDPQATATFETLCMTLEVRDAIQKPAVASAVGRLRVRLPEAHWELLCKVLKAPTGGYAIYGHCVVGFIREVVDAKPVKEESES